VVVFNPNSATHTDVVSAAIELPNGVDEFDLLDENGTSLPYQTHGLGSREIINMTMDAKACRPLLARSAKGAPSEWPSRMSG
jgi:hypothetical protein